MSDTTDHAAMIRENVRLVSQHIDEFDMHFAKEHLDDIVAWADELAARLAETERNHDAMRRHAKDMTTEKQALKDRLAEAEGRIERLRLAFLDAEDDSIDYALPERNANNPHDPLTEEAWRTVTRARLHDGDLAPADPEGQP